MFRGRAPRQKRSQRQSEVRRTFDTPLEELTFCLDRMEELIEKTCNIWYRGGEEEETQVTGLQPSVNKTQRGLFRGSSSRKVENQPNQSLGTGESKAKFIAMPPDEEEEIIELIRRIAELVVMGEKAAAAGQNKADKRRQNNPMDEAEDEETEARIQSQIALFENFFERNALALIVNMVTGASFEASKVTRKPKAVSDEISESGDTASDISDPKVEMLSIKSDTAMLPPILVAIQAIQSVSILIQNVSRATSLYFLLSNNYVNDLINLPLELYNCAERFRRGDSSLAVRQHASPEMAELTTHYVTFLKSLALRMNAETLQFFLTYPAERGEDQINQIPASSKHFCSVDDINILEEEDDGDIPMGERKSKQSKAPMSPVSKPVQVTETEVEFPLYARALEYCASHRDSFVRVTAMNICLNTLRLATVSPLAEGATVDFDENASSPDGSLFNAQALPLRERLAIAQHVCAPSRVEALVSPIFTKLAHLWGVVEEQIRDIDKLREGILDKDSGSRIRDSKMERAKAETKKKRLSSALQDSLADLQDELLLLEDVFKVGLTSLSEQTIEMMLATFVYPLLLQPLLLYMQRHNNPSSDENTDMVDVLTLGAETSASQAGVDHQDENKIQEAAPAKTALFALTAVFELLTNQPLMRLLFTALFHPLAPDSSGETMIRAKPDVAGIGPGGALAVRVDTFLREDPTEKVTLEMSPYSFGNVTGTKSVKGEQNYGEESCVYVLSPALTEVLEGKAGDLSLIAKTRANPYRRAILKCLSAGPNISNLRQVAVLLLDAVVTRFDCKFSSDILFGVGLKTLRDDIPLDERNLDSRRSFIQNNRDMGARNANSSRHSLAARGGESFMGEVISALCLSTINVSTYYQGMWKLVFDGTAAHALLLLAKENQKAVDLASKTMEGRRRLSSIFLSEYPLMMDIIVGPPGSEDDKEDEDEEMRVGRHAHEMFFKSASGKQFSVVGELLKLKPTVGNTEQGEFSVSVAVAGKFDDVINRMCNFGKLQLDPEVPNAVLQMAATSAMALVQVDALADFLKELAATNCNALKGDAPSAFSISRLGVLVSTKLSPGTDVNRSIFSPISPRMGTNLLRLDEEMSEKELPKPGTVVGLVGRTAIPCVCEVPESCAPLLTDANASVVADGVKWLSLYLVFLGRYMILAEPERKGSGGNGRVVSACHLTRLRFEKDVLPPAGNSSPARRLIVTHQSLDPTPPGLFLPVESPPKPITFGPFTRLTLNKASLDVWFEDESAADHAHRVMIVKLGRALAKRGNRLRQKLAADE